MEFKWSKSVPEDQFSREFIQGMLNRVAHAYWKYGHNRRKDHKPDSIKMLEDRLKLYKKTGNMEWLIDVANFAMLETMIPSHKKAHFRATSAEESPGAVIDGKRVRSRVDYDFKQHHVQQREGD